MRKHTPYTSQYIEQCFGIWYAASQPSPAALIKTLPQDEYGRIPTQIVIRKWINNLWTKRAAELDNRALELRNNSLVIQKASLLQKQAEDAYALAQKAHSHLLTSEFDSSAAAVQAYFRATEEIRKVVGLSEILQRLGEMSDDDIQEEIKKRLARAAEAGQIIVDGETEELASDSDEETP